MQIQASQSARLSKLWVCLFQEAGNGYTELGNL